MAENGRTRTGTVEIVDPDQLAEHVLDRLGDLTERVEAIEAQLAAAREQAEQMAARLPAPIRKMMGL